MQEANRNNLDNEKDQNAKNVYDSISHLLIFSHTLKAHEQYDAAKVADRIQQQIDNFQSTINLNIDHINNKIKPEKNARRLSENSEKQGYIFQLEAAKSKL